MTNINNSVYLCKEVFDEKSEPSKIEIDEQAYRLGIDAVKETNLLYIAKQCLLEPLPINWVPCFIEQENKYFYFNKQSKISQWEHPLDEYYRQIVEKTRSEDSSTGQDVSLNIIPNEDSFLDNIMYHSTNSNYEKKTVTEKRTVRFKTPIVEPLELDNSDDMKFLGPIKLNTPYSSMSSTLQNLPQFSTTNALDTRSSASRSVLSKYNILPSKNELSRKSDLNEDVKKVNDVPTKNLDYSLGKENLKKIDITLTESTDRTESTSSEIQTENLNSDYEENDLKEKYNPVETFQINKRHDRNDIINDDGKSASDNFNKLQSRGSTQLYNVKKDDLISDSGNSTAKDSKLLQSTLASNSFSITKNKMAEIAQRFSSNQYTNETKISNLNSIASDESVLGIESNNVISKFELANNSNNEKQSTLDAAQIQVIIEKYCNSIKNKLEETINTKENIFREELLEKFDDAKREQNNHFEKHIDAQYNELLTKNELEIKNIIKNTQEKIEKSLVGEGDKKYIHTISKAEQMCADNLNKFQKSLDNFAQEFKDKMQMELDVISNGLKKEYTNKSETMTDSWNQTLESFKKLELEKVKSNFKQTTENIKRDTEDEIRQFNLEFKEKLKVISEDKLNNITDQLEVALREEINLVKKRVNQTYQENINTKILMSKAFINSSEQESNLKYLTTDTHQVNYSDIRQKIQHCSNELNDALKLVTEISPPNTHNTVSCQTENPIMSNLKPNLKEYPYYRGTSIMPFFNNLHDVNTSFTDYLNHEKMCEDLSSNYMTTYSQIFNPLNVLNREESKVNAVEQNICRLIDTNNSKYTNYYNTPYNTHEYQNKFSNIYQELTPKRIAYNRTKNLREWLYKTNLNITNK